MSARKSLPIGFIIMLIVMALAALGVGYAWWSEQLTASGSIQTGSIDVKIENVVIEEDDELDSAACTYSLAGDGKGMTVSVRNVYPAYTCVMRFDLNNHGTVPARVTRINLPGPHPGFSVVASDELASLTDGSLDPNIIKTARVTVEILEGAAQQASYSFNISLEVSQGNAP